MRAAVGSSGIGVTTVFFLHFSFLLLMKWDIPIKRIPAPLAVKKKNNARPTGEPHDKITYKTSIIKSSFFVNLDNLPISARRFVLVKQTFPAPSFRK
jgi:hypothetical protein